MSHDISLSQCVFLANKMTLCIAFDETGAFRDKNSLAFVDEILCVDRPSDPSRIIFRIM